MDQDDDGAVTIRDPRAIKALAHPARLAVIDRLFAGEVLTATECAEAVGLTPSAMSYHLRALEKWGLVRRAEAAGDARERPWRAAGTTLRIDRSAGRAAVAAGELVVQTSLDELTSAVADAFVRQRADGTDPVPMAFLRATERLTREEFTRLTAEVESLLESYGGRTPPPDAQRYQFWWVVTPEPPRPPGA